MYTEAGDLQQLQSLFEAVNVTDKMEWILQVTWYNMLPAYLSKRSEVGTEGSSLLH